MEGKNLVLAISLSALVLIMWSVFFAPPPPTIEKEQNKDKELMRAIRPGNNPYSLNTFRGGGKVLKCRRTLFKLWKVKL